MDLLTALDYLVYGLASTVFCSWAIFSAWVLASYVKHTLFSLPNFIKAKNKDWSSVIARHLGAVVGLALDFVFMGYVIKRMLAL